MTSGRKKSQGRWSGFGWGLMIGAMLAVSPAGAMASCSVEDKRVCQMEEALRFFSGGRSVAYFSEGTAGAGMAAEYEWVIGGSDIIHLGDTQAFDDEALLFLLAHERGHSVLGHGRKLVESFAAEPDRGLGDRELYAKYGEAAIAGASGRAELNRAQEFEADAFAIKALRSMGVDPAAAMGKALRGWPSSSTHPSRRERMGRARGAG